MKVDTLIRGGTIVDPLTGVYPGAVAIADGRIAGVLSGPLGIRAEREIDASGLHVFPGVVEPHTHIGFSRPFGDDLESETRSAAIGGVTTVFSFHRHYGGAEPQPYDDFSELRETIESRATVDVGLHFGILTRAQVDQLDKYIDWGVSSFKFYMAYRGDDGRTVGIVNECDDGVLLEGLTTIGRYRHAVAAVHCENTEIIGPHVARAKAEGADGLAGWHRARPVLGEIESVRRIAYYGRASGATVYVVHAGSPEVVAEIRAQRATHPALYAETCPHYLTHSIESPAGNLAKITPPLRPRSAVDGLWEHVRQEAIDTVGTDHCATTRASKAGPIWQATSGFPGMATALPALLSAGYHDRGVRLQTIARLTSYGPARIFNLLPRKGTLRPGTDADLILVDLELERDVRPETLGSWSDYSIYEGQRLRGWPVETIVRGQTVAHGGRVTAVAGTGRFVRH